jgi:hypothetical protein
MRMGLRNNDNASDPGAQTERRGEAGPVRDQLGGETSPAALSSKPREVISSMPDQCELLRPAVAIPTVLGGKPFRDVSFSESNQDRKAAHHLAGAGQTACGRR